MPERTFGEEIRRLREEKCKTDPSFTLRQFAERIGVSPTYLSQIERGKLAVPTEDRIKAIAKALGTELDYLMELAGKIASDLPEIIKEKPGVTALLRTVKAKNLSPDQLKKLTQRIENGQI